MATLLQLAKRVALTIISIQLLVLLTSPSASAAPGGIDNSFGGSGQVSTTLVSNPNGTMVTDSTGNIYVATSKYTVANGHDVAVYKMDSNGAMAWSGSGIVTVDFASGTDDALDLAVDSLGRIYVVGYAVSSGTKAFILRITAAGVLDSSFGTGGKVLWKPSELSGAALTSISIDSSDRIFLAGNGSVSYSSPNRTVNNAFVASITSSGSLDSSFSSDGYEFIPPSTYGDSIQDSVIDNNGDLVVSGQWLSDSYTAGGGSRTQYLVARFNVDGTYDTGFAGTGILKTPRGNLSGSWKRINVDENNNYLLTGMTYRTSAQTEWDLAFDKYTDTGTNLVSKSFDTGWGEEGVFVAPGPNGTVLVGARTTIPRSGTSYYDSAAILLRLDSNGLLDSTFGTAGMTAKNMSGDLTSGSMVDGGWLGLTRGTGRWTVIKYLTPDFASAPVSLSGSPSAEQIDLSWSIPNSNGGASITDYAIEISTDNSNWTLVTDGVSLTRNLTIGSLTPNSTYFFRVAAITSAGTGLFAYTSSILTSMPAVPGAPSLSCSISGLQVSLAWTPNQGGGRFETGYLIQRKLGSGEWTDLTSKASSVFTFTESTNSSQSGNISYKIRSANDGGNSNWSNACTISAPYIPSAPSSASGPSLSNRNMTLSWTAPSDGGIQIDTYEIDKRVGVSGSWSQVYSAGPIAGNLQIFSEVKPTLSAGETHYYRIRAVNAVGNSQWSNTYSVQIPSVPSVPTSITATGNSNDITISWSAPSNIDTSGPITYSFQITNNGVTWSDFTPSSYPLASSAIFDSAISGTNYRFRVKSVNSFGESAWSSSSNLVQLSSSATPPSSSPGSTTVIINTPEVVINTPAVTVYSPSVSVGAKLSATSIATGLGVPIPSKAKTTVAISKSSKKFCKVSGGKVVGIKSGPCVATVTVQAPKPKKGKKPAPVKKSVTVQIS